jgi:hypothetical protein
MATTTFNIYKSTDGMLRLDNYTATYPNQDWEQFLQETGQTDRLERLNAMRSRDRSPRVCRLRKSEPFKQWQRGKTITVTSELYGVATADYDGRLPEGSIKYAILNAIRNGETEARYYPRSNARKPAHEHLVYCFDYDFQKAE